MSYPLPTHTTFPYLAMPLTSSLGLLFPCMVCIQSNISFSYSPISLPIPIPLTSLSGLLFPCIAWIQSNISPSHPPCLHPHPPSPFPSHLTHIIIRIIIPLYSMYPVQHIPFSSPLSPSPSPISLPFPSHSHHHQDYYSPV